VAWHFSSVLLVPDHSDWPAEVEVESVSPHRVVLSRSDDALRPGVYGIEWRGGRAIAGAVVRRGPDTVTRRLRGVNGYLVPGKNVAIEPDVFAGDPAQALGLPFSTVRIKGELGRMPAWLIPGRSQAWAIVVHGHNGSPEEGLRLVPALHREGLPTLLMTYRDDLVAPASPDGYHHLGQTEWHDLDAAARYALDHGARRLVLIGYSMGGAIAAQFIEHSPLASRVAGLVLDAPALDWRAVVEFNATRMGLPSFAALPVEWVTGARISVDWDSLDALAHSEDFHLPILLFHGSDDRLVPISTSEDFAAALPRWVTFFQVPGAGHTESWNADPALYEHRLETFLAQITAARALSTGRRAG
jgi:alpha-beta hydrolase superfamily lysophospholipase